MHDLNRRYRRSHEEHEMERETTVHPRFSHGTWVAVAVGGAAVLGAGTAVYGASQNRVAQNKANDTTQQNADKTNQYNWANYLMSRGIQPNTPAEVGQVPTAGNFTAVNSRLPLWANLTTSPVSAPLTVVRRTTPKTPTYSLGPTTIG